MVASVKFESMPTNRLTKIQNILNIVVVYKYPENVSKNVIKIDHPKVDILLCVPYFRG